MSAPATRSCPECQTPLPAGMRPEFCTVCLLREASEETGDAVGSEEPTSRIGDYDLLGEIARGGMGVVFRARQRSLGRTVAVKLLLGGGFAGENARNRFRTEASAAARLQHPNIVAIHDIGEHDGQLFFSMDLIEGGTLADQVRQGPLPAREVTRLGGLIAAAVHYAHQQGVLHRDLKPSNVLIDREGQPHVTDFGLAKHLESTVTLTHTGDVLGSPAYASPEQVRGETRLVGYGSDVYSMGALLYHLMTGRPPFQGDSVEAVLRQVADAEPVSPRRLNPSVPIDLETVCLRCLEKHPAQRYATAGEVAEELDRILAGEPVRARPVGWMGRSVRWAQRRPGIAVLVAALVLSLAGLVTGGLVATVRIYRAERQALVNLRESLLVQARALRLAGGPGQQIASVAAVDRALALGLGGNVRDRAAAEIVAALAQTDCRFEATPGLSVSGGGRLRVGSQAGTWRCLGEDGWIREIEAGSGRVQASWRLLWDGANRLGDASVGQRRQVVSGTKGLAVVELGDAAEGRVIWESPVIPEAVGLSRDGRWLVTGEGQTELVWHDLDAGTQSRMDGGPGGWRHLAFSPDGHQLAASRLTTNQVDLFRVDSREVEVRLPQPGPIFLLSWSPDSQRFAAATHDGRLFYHDVPGRNRILSFTFAPAVPLGLSFDPSGRWVASAWDDRTVRVWDVHAGRMLVAAHGDAGSLEFSPDGLAFGPVRSRGSVGFYRMIPPVGFTELLAGYVGSSELEVEFSADSSLVAGRHPTGVRVFDTTTGDWKAWVPLEFPRGFSFGRDPNRLVTVDRVGVIGWSLDQKATNGWSRREALHGSPAVAVKSWISGQRSAWLALLADGRLAEVSDVPGVPVRVVGLHPGADTLAVDPTGHWAATAAPGVGEVRFWDLDRRCVVHAEMSGGQAGAAFSPDGKTAAVWGDRFELLETGSWKRSGALPLPDPVLVLGAAAFSPDGRHLAVVSDVYDVLVVDQVDHRVEVVIEPPTRVRIFALAWSPDGTRLAAATAQGKLRLWHMPTLADKLASRGLPGRVGQ